MNDPILIRKLLREALSLAAERWFIETLLYKSTRSLAGELKVAEFSDARNWNEARGYIEKRHNNDYDEHEWRLTPAGREKEGL